ncbi:hypothetical protein C8R47DRAFT_1318876 [Mycena vitilis]|nr:hypothetical protein C8R47DRAFT_1318876 [Mycena vitilis]
MKLVGYLVLLNFLVIHALAQGIEIGAPANGTIVKAGRKIVVDVQKPDTLTGSTELALVIAFLHCGSTPCPSPLSYAGTILYNGTWNPQFPTSPKDGDRIPHQNFTVTIPSFAVCGTAQLSVTHFSIVGASGLLFLQNRTITLEVK